MLDEVKGFLGAAQLEEGDYFCLIFQSSVNSDLSMVSKVMVFGGEGVTDLLYSIFVAKEDVYLPVDNGLSYIPNTVVDESIISIVRLGERDIWNHEVLDVLSGSGYSPEDVSVKQLDLYYKKNLTAQEVLAEVERRS
jgi:hypothetical protein